MDHTFLSCPSFGRFTDKDQVLNLGYAIMLLDLYSNAEQLKAKKYINSKERKNQFGIYFSSGVNTTFTYSSITALILMIDLIHVSSYPKRHVLYINFSPLNIVRKIPKNFPKFADGPIFNSL